MGWLEWLTHLLHMLPALPVWGQVRRLKVHRLFSRGSNWTVIGKNDLYHQRPALSTSHSQARLATSKSVSPLDKSWAVQIPYSPNPTVWRDCAVLCLWGGVHLDARAGVLLTSFTAVGAPSRVVCSSFFVISIYDHNHFRSLKILINTIANILTLLAKCSNLT